MANFPTDNDPGTEVSGPRMLVFDSAYTYEILTRRKIEVIVTGRDLGGYFEHIWTCHPVASLLVDETSTERFGRPQFHELAPGHTMIEGRIGRFASLRRFQNINFLLAQIDLFVVLWRLIGRERIDIVRSEDPHYNGLCAWLMSRLRRLPLLVGVWGNPGAVRAVTGRPLMPRIFRKVAVEEAVERFVLRRADRVMVQNANNGEFVKDYGVSDDRIAIFRLGNLLHEDHFSAPESRTGGAEALAEFGITGHDTLAVLSRLEPLKLVDHVVSAVSLLKQRGRPVTAILVGDGVGRDDLEELANRLEIADRIVFAGNRDQQWIARVVAHVSMVVSPLTGRALGEAALGGAPLVAYDIDWHGEIVETGKTGELVEYLNIEKLADAIERLLDNPDMARRYGDAVRDRAMAMLDPKTADRDQAALYDQLLGRKPLGSGQR